jgi:aryl-alcohol dehydrogenase-like predicted oxidoreductase
MVKTTEKEDSKDDDDVFAVKKTEAALDAFAETKSAAATVSTAEDLRLEFESSKPCALDFLMARYNMAHCKAEWRLFPVAQARDVPVIAFTSTRWNSLQKGHPRWHSSDPPSTAACMNWSLSHPAVQVVLNSAPDVGYLSEWADELSETGVRTMDEKDIEKWKEYGELVYDESAAFETLF